MVFERSPRVQFFNQGSLFSWNTGCPHVSNKEHLFRVSSSSFSWLLSKKKIQEPEQEQEWEREREWERREREKEKEPQEGEFFQFGVGSLKVTLSQRSPELQRKLQAIPRKFSKRGNEELNLLFLAGALDLLLAFLQQIADDLIVSGHMHCSFPPACNVAHLTFLPDMWGRNRTQKWYPGFVNRTPDHLCEIATLFLPSHWTSCSCFASFSWFLSSSCSLVRSRSWPEGNLWPTEQASPSVLQRA